MENPADRPSPVIAASQTFIEAYNRLPLRIRKKTDAFLATFRSCPDSPDLNYEKLTDAAMPDYRSVRIDETYRTIISRPDTGNVYLLLWVDSHENASAWAASHVCNVNSETGSLQLYETMEPQSPTPASREETAPSAPPERASEPAPAAVCTPLFSAFSDKQLLSLGVPADRMDPVRSITNRNALEALQSKIPSDAFDSLLRLADGHSIDTVKETYADTPEAPDAAARSPEKPPAPDQAAVGRPPAMLPQTTQTSDTTAAAQNSDEAIPAPEAPSDPLDKYTKALALARSRRSFHILDNNQSAASKVRISSPVNQPLQSRAGHNPRVSPKGTDNPTMSTQASLSVNSQITPKTDPKPQPKQTVSVNFTDGKHVVPTADRMVEELCLIERAHRDGASEKPNSTDSTDYVADEVRTRINQIAINCNTWVKPLITNHNNCINTEVNTLKQTIDDANSITNRFQSEARDLLRGEEIEKQKAYQNWKNAKAEFERFRQENNLIRPAHTPLPSQKRYHIALLLFLVFFETIVNAGFFGVGLEGGLLAGAFVALGASALNTGAAFLLGKNCLRLLFHANNRIKLFGCLWLLFTVLFCLSLGLTIGHYRDALTLAVESPGTYAKIALLDHPFNLNDIVSILLTALTMVFGAVSALDGIYFDDPYPGYSQQEEHYNRFCEEWIDRLEDLQQGLSELKDQKLSELDAKMAMADSSLASVKSSVLKKAEDVSSYHHALTAVKDLYPAVLSIYRQENLIARQTAVPDYFNQTPVYQMELDPLPGDSVQRDIEQLQILEHAVNELRARAELNRTALISAFENEYSAAKLDAKIA